MVDMITNKITNIWTSYRALLLDNTQRVKMLEYFNVRQSETACAFIENSCTTHVFVD